MRITLSDVRASRIPIVLGICSDDPRLVAYVNEAQQRLLSRGKWWGTYQRIRVCVTNGCLTWPRQVATIEQVSICNAPLTVRNEWFEFLGEGPGLDGGCFCSSDLLDRGTVPAFADIIGVNKQIKVYADVAEAADSKILLLGYDENNNWIRTQVDGIWVDGEQVLISTTPQTTTKFFSSLTGVQKPVTNGNVRLYEYDTDLLTQRAIAIYEPGETRPVYRRSYIPGLVVVPNENDEECQLQTVTAMATLEFIPVRDDADFLIIGNIPALKDMCMALRKLENNEFQESKAYEASAIVELRAELARYMGDGVVVPLNMVGAETYGGGICNPI